MRLSSRPTSTSMGTLGCSVAVVSLALESAAAHADSRPLTRGWVLHERVLPSGLEDIGCGEERAYVRSWFGNVAAWDGARWRDLPSRSDATYGRTLAVSPGGTVYLGGGDHLSRWDGSRWDDLALSTWAGDMDDQMLAPTDDSLFVVGWGRIARLESDTLHTYGAGTWRELHAVAMDGGELLVAGQGGTIQRFRSGVWSRESTGIATTVHRLFVAGPADVWAWADGETWQSSTLLHLEAGAWVRRDLPIAQRVSSIGGGRGATFATTDEALLRWDESSHAWMPELTTAEIGEGYQQLEGVCATREHVLVGDASNVLVRQLAP
jgi:hypothetical protein